MYTTGYHISTIMFHLKCCNAWPSLTRLRYQVHRHLLSTRQLERGVEHPRVWRGKARVVAREFRGVRVEIWFKHLEKWWFSMGLNQIEKSWRYNIYIYIHICIYLYIVGKYSDISTIFIWLVIWNIFIHALGTPSQLTLIIFKREGMPPNRFGTKCEMRVKKKTLRKTYLFWTIRNFGFNRWFSSNMFGSKLEKQGN